MSNNLRNTLLIVAAVALYYVIIQPLYTGAGSVWQPEQSVKSLRELSDQYTQAVAQAEGLYSQAEGFRRDYGAITPDTKQKLESMVPAAVDPVRLVSEVNSIANYSGVILDDINYTQDTGNANAGRGAYLINFSTETTYVKFKELMRNYETSLRLYNVESVMFSAPKDRDDTTTTFQVRLSTYYIK